MFGALPPPGDREIMPLVAGYAPIRLLGAGASAVVWLAEQHQPFARRVALKIFASASGSQSMLERFRAERDILARLPREGFRDIYDAGVSADGRPYLAMEFVDGDGFLAVAATLSDAEAVALLFIDIGGILGQAHGIGLVHLDLKPSNVLVERAAGGRLRPRIIDFGLGASAGTRSPGGGTQGFASPEVQRGGLCSSSSDVYSLAAMLRAVLALRPGPQRSDLERRLWAVSERNLSDTPAERAADGTAFAREIVAELHASRRRRLLSRATIAATGGVAALGAGWLAWPRPRTIAPAAYRPVERLVPEQYPTVQAAVDAARTGDVVRIAPGVYHGHVRLDGKSVSLRGMPGMASQTVLDAAGYTAETLGIYAVEPPLSTVSDLTITHSGVKGLSACGIAYQKSGGGQIRFERCIIRENIAVSDSIPGGANILGDAVFEACAFIGNRAGYRGAAFAVYDGCTVDAIDCSFRDHREGVALIAVRNSALVRLDGCVIVGSTRLCTAKRDSQIVFRHCRGSDIQVTGGTGFIDGGANCWDCCVDEDGDGVPDLESAITGPRQGPDRGVI